MTLLPPNPCLNLTGQSQLRGLACSEHCLGDLWAIVTRVQARAGSTNGCVTACATSCRGRASYLHPHMSPGHPPPTSLCSCWTAGRAQPVRGVAGAAVGPQREAHQPHGLHWPRAGRRAAQGWLELKVLTIIKESLTSHQEACPVNVHAQGSSRNHSQHERP